MAAPGDIHFGAARALRSCKKGIEKRAAGVGVDFDQPGAVFAKMKVVAHQCPERTVIRPRDFRRPGEDRGLVCLELGGGLHSHCDRAHLIDGGGRKEHRHVREQVGLGADERLEERRLTCLLLQRLAQRWKVQCNAEAVLVEPLRAVLNPLR